MSAPLRRAAHALVVVSSLGLAASPVAAVNGAKNNAAPRPVARLITTSKQEVPTRVRERLVARSSYTPAAAPAASAAVAATGDERRTFELINDQRRRRGLRELVFDPSLTRVARYHSQNMARQGFFNHVDRDGLDLSGRAQVLGVRGWRALGENIAYNQGYDDPAAFAVERWMISSKHRENILNGDFTHAGLGVARTSDGRVFFTQVFMRR